MFNLIFAAALSGGVLNLPVMDHARAIEVRPISSDVIMCAAADALPIARQLAELHPDDPETDRAMTAGGCMQTFSTDPMLADFQEDVDWIGSITPPRMVRGRLRVVRVRSTVSLGASGEMDSYYYVAADDLVAAGPAADDRSGADAAAKWCAANHVPRKQCYQGTGGAIPPSGIPDDE